jgi:hypothetical protein
VRSGKLRSLPLPHCTIIQRLHSVLEATAIMTKIILIFESRQTTAGPNEQIFIEAHDESGKSINVGDWSADGEHEALTIDCAALCGQANNKHLKALDDVTAVAIDPGNALASDYMRGMANGLLLAQSIFSGNDPQFLDAEGRHILRSSDDWLQNATKAKSYE